MDTLLVGHFTCWTLYLMDTLSVGKVFYSELNFVKLVNALQYIYMYILLYIVVMTSGSMNSSCSANQRVTRLKSCRLQKVDEIHAKTVGD